MAHIKPLLSEKADMHGKNSIRFPAALWDANKHLLMAGYLWIEPLGMNLIFQSLTDEMSDFDPKMVKTITIDGGMEYEIRTLVAQKESEPGSYDLALAV